jgi:hypothetical protein
MTWILLFTILVLIANALCAGCVVLLCAACKVSADDAKFALDNAKRAYDDALKAAERAKESADRAGQSARAARREAIGLGG